MARSISTSAASTVPANATRPFAPNKRKPRVLPEPTDPDEHTRVKDPNEPFQFSFADLTGKLVSNTDPQFQGKVVIVNITAAGARIATTKRRS